MVRTNKLFALPLILLAAMALAGCGGIASAAEEEQTKSEEIEFTGIVQAIGDGEWLVSERVLTITAESEIESGIELGDEVRVEAQRTDDGTLVAWLIVPVEEEGDDKPPAEDEGGDSEEKDRNGDEGETDGEEQPGSEEQEGDHHDGDGEGEPKPEEHEGNGEDEPKPEPEEDEAGERFQIKGFVQELGEALWTVSGTTFRVTHETKIEGTVLIGSVVRVELLRSGDGTLVAEVVERLYSEDNVGDDEDDNGGNDEGGGEHEEEPEPEEDPEPEEGEKPPEEEPEPTPTPEVGEGDGV